MAEDHLPQLMAAGADDDPPDVPVAQSRELFRLILLVATLIGLCLMLYLFRQVWGDGLSADTV